MEELLNGTYYSMFKNNELIGYFCFGESAIVPTGDLYNVYEQKEFVDVGIGMKPELCGNGQGEEFFREVLKFGKENMGAKNFRLTVISFNERAIKVYEKIGFVKTVMFKEYSDDRVDTHVVMINTNKDI